MPDFSGLFSQRLPNLLGGVSQAPDTLKQPNEWSNLENIYVDPLVGLRKRSGTTHVASLRGYASDMDKSFFHHINMGDTERYTVMVVNGDLKVYDTLTGIEQTVYFPDGTDYLIYSNLNNWRATTVGDTTYFVNREKIVRRDSTKTSKEQKNGALVTIYNTAEETHFSFVLDGILVRYDTFKKDSVTTDIGAAASALWDLANRTLPLSEYGIDRYGNTLHIYKRDGTNFTIRIGSGLGDAAMKLVKGTVKSWEELPPSAPIGTLLRISGQATTGLDDIWVEAWPGDPEDRITGATVTWKETVAPGIQVAMDALTLPHRLVRGNYYLETLQARAGNWAFPYSVNGADDVYLYGYAEDLAGAPKDETKTRFVTDNGTGGRTKDTATLAGAKAKGIWRWAVDTTLVPAGHITRVHVALEDGVGGYLTQADYEYEPGQAYLNERHEFTFDASLVRNATLTLYHDVGEAPGGANYPKLTLYGSVGTLFQGFRQEMQNYTDVYVGNEGDTFPYRMRIQMDCDGHTIDTYLSDDTSVEDLAGIIAGGLTGGGDFTSVIPSSGPGDPWRVRFQGVGSLAAASFSGDYTIDRTKVFYTPYLSLIPGSLIGLTIRNHSTGATATITNNSTVAIYCADGLTGGSRNTFKEGDEVTIEGVSSSAWVFQKCPWEERKVGDLKQSPWPSFMGKTVHDVFYHKGRLGFVSENNIVCGAVGKDETYRFFRKTVTAVLESDPIDVKIASKEATSIESAVEWNSMLILSTSGGLQYSLSGTPVLSPQTATLEHISSYPSSDWVRPYRLSGSLIFARKQGSYSNIREMFEGIYGRIETHLLTEKVPQFVPGDVVAMAGDADLGWFGCLVNDASNRASLYVWQFKHNQTGELVVSAWGKWYLQHSSMIYSIDMYRGKLTLVARSWPNDPSGTFIGTGFVCLESIDLTRPPLDSEQYADRQSAPGGPYSIQSRITFPVLYRRDASGVPQTEGRTQVRNLKVDYRDTQFLAVNVDPGGPAIARSSIIPNTTASSTTKLNGSLRVPVLCENTQVTLIEIVNTGRTGFTITGIEWEAFFHSRNVRV